MEGLQEARCGHADKLQMRSLVNVQLNMIERGVESSSINKRAYLTLIGSCAIPERSYSGHLGSVFFELSPALGLRSGHGLVVNI